MIRQMWLTSEKWLGMLSDLNVLPEGLVERFDGSIGRLRVRARGGRYQPPRPRLWWLNFLLKDIQILLP